MVWHSSSDAVAGAASAAARALLLDAGGLARTAVMRAPALVDSVRWRSPAFEAFRASVDAWRTELDALAAALDAAPDSVPVAAAPCAYEASFTSWRQ